MSREGHNAGKKDGALLCGSTKRAGVVQAGEQKAPAPPYWGLSVFKGSYKRDYSRIFIRACCDRTKDNGFKLKKDGFS